MSNYPTITPSIGRLYWNEVRDYIGKKEFIDPRISHYEGKGTLKKDFVIKAPPEVMGNITREVCAWINNLDSPHNN